MICVEQFTPPALSFDKPHKHDSNKHQTKAFVICDHKSDQSRSATHVNKTYLVWLMYWLLFNQHYQHRTNQKLCSWANAVFQNRGVYGPAFPALPFSSPVIPIFLLSSELSRPYGIGCLNRFEKIVIGSVLLWTSTDGDSDYEDDCLYFANLQPDSHGSEHIHSSTFPVSHR